MHDYKKLYEDLCKAIIDNTEEWDDTPDGWNGPTKDEHYIPLVRIQYIADEMETYNNSITK